MYNIGLTTPNKESRVFFNQLMFADACNFNNIYGFVVPKIEKYVNSIRVNYLTTAQKEAIINSIGTEKTSTAEIILLDPVYTAVTVGTSKTNQSAVYTDKDYSYLSVVPNDNSKADLTYIKTQIQSILQSYFANSNCTFGQTVDVASINDQILNISGIKKIYTKRTDSDISVEGVSLMIWNPVYTTDLQETTKNITLESFKFPFLYDVETIIDNIVLETSTINGVPAIEY